MNEQCEESDYTTLKTYVSEGHNVFLTGPGGSGKSYSINQLRLDFEMDVTSTTGVSAVNIGGKTIHNFSGIGVIRSRDSVEDIIKKVKKSGATRRLRECSRLVIDEVSMLGSSFLETLNKVFMNIRADSRVFGGVQLILTGDFLQLPPINDSFCFLSDVWGSLNLKIIHLKTLYRFTDQKYSEMLTRIRKAKNTFEDNRELFKRFFAHNSLMDDYDKYEALKIKPTFLYSKRIDVMEKNLEELEKNPEPLVVSVSKDIYTDKNETLYLDLLAPKNLHLKVGAQVMLTINHDVENGLSNGSRGVVEVINDKNITVSFLNGVRLAFEPNVFVHEERKKIISSRSQYPFILAYSLSIHKCQGSTLDCAVVDIGNSIFEASQAYVALSRVKSLEGLYIKSYRPDKIYVDEQALKFYEDDF